jgi:hypothetical protein
MKKSGKRIGTLFLLAIIPLICQAQCTSDTSTSACTRGIPHFVKFGGMIRSQDSSSRPGIVTVKFVIYDDYKAGNALWQEIQNVQLDSDGRYDVMLGSTAPDGMPTDIFTSGDPRWLGAQVVRPGSEELPRVLMVSVPYAMEAADAQTLGGLPASAFARVGSVSSATTSGAPAVFANPGIPGATATPAEGAIFASPNAPGAAIERRIGPVDVNVIPKFSGGGLASSQITDAGGTVTMQNLANILFADQFAGGVPDAVAACPANGCIIYALTPNVNLNLGSIDPGTKAITIYLGPYVFNVRQITLRRALKIIGMGASGSPNGTAGCSVALPCNGTILQSINGNNPVFVLPQVNDTPATNVHLAGFRVFGSVGNTSEDGFFLDTSSTTNTGLWYSALDDIFMQGFAGVSIHIKGRNNDFAATSQWVLFNNVAVYRSAGGGNALRLEGAVFQLRFRNCQFDGQGVGDGTNIFLGGTQGGPALGAAGYPTSITFEGLVSQGAALAVQIDGAVNTIFYGSHHEGLSAGYRVTVNTGIATRGLTISDTYFAGNVGSNGGAGYELSVETTLASGIFFVHNQMFGNPDAIVKSTNLASVVYQDNLYAGSSNAPPTSGVTFQLSPATSINALGAHSVGLNPSATPITTIQSGLGPGETITFFTLAGSVTFAAGGNIDLMGASSIAVNGTITFIRSDLGGSLWKPVSQWSPPASTANAAVQSDSAIRQKPVIVLSERPSGSKLSND